MADIIEFPKQKRLGSPPQNEDELQEQVADFRYGLADQVSELIWQSVLTELIRSGCDFGDEPSEYFPSIVLVLETIKSLHLLSQGLHHPLQDFANDAIDLDEYHEEVDKILDNEEDID